MRKAGFGNLEVLGERFGEKPSSKKVLPDITSLSAHWHKLNQQTFASVFPVMVNMATSDLSKLKISSDERTTASRGSRRWLRWIIVGSAALALAALLWWSGIVIRPSEITVTRVSMTFASRALTILNASGYVVAQRKAAVSSKATGRLQELFVEEGKVVKTGDVLAILENGDLDATLEEAKAALHVAQANLSNAEAELEDATLNYDRQKSLRESGAVSVQAFDTSDARYRKAQASVRSARFGVERAAASIKIAQVNLEYSFIRAPFDGVILTKNADIGEIVAPFGASVNSRAAVATMADMSSLMVEVDVAESGIEKIKPNSAAEIKLDAFPNDRFPGTVHMIVPTADRAKATVLTKVRFNELDPRVLPEMSAKVAFLSRPLKPDELEPFLGVPASAVKKVGGTNIVFKIVDIIAKRTPIQIGRTWSDTFEVLSGLTQGDAVALDPDKLRDGEKVKIKE